MKVVTSGGARRNQRNMIRAVARKRRMLVSMMTLAVLMVAGTYLYQLSSLPGYLLVKVESRSLLSESDYTLLSEDVLADEKRHGAAPPAKLLRELRAPVVAKHPALIYTTFAAASSTKFLTASTANLAAAHRETHAEVSSDRVAAPLVSKRPSASTDKLAAASLAKLPASPVKLKTSPTKFAVASLSKHAAASSTHAPLRSNDDMFTVDPSYDTTEAPDDSKPRNNKNARRRSPWQLPPYMSGLDDANMEDLLFGGGHHVAHVVLHGAGGKFMEYTYKGNGTVMPSLDRADVKPTLPQHSAPMRRGPAEHRVPKFIKEIREFAEREASMKLLQGGGREGEKVTGFLANLTNYDPDVIIDYTRVLRFANATRSFPRRGSAITFTTQASWPYLHHLALLARRWDGPIAVAVYTPGDSYDAAADTIRQLRRCHPLVWEKVTFSLFFPARLSPASRGKMASVSDSTPCDLLTFPLPGAVDMGRFGAYPTNAGRNTARMTVETEYMLLADIELTPSVDLSARFYDFLRRHGESERAVYVLPPFELERGFPVPENKEQLKQLLKNETAVPFHQVTCADCHGIPFHEVWLAANVTDKLDVFFVTKWAPPSWEPVYISTNGVPLHDERFRGYGKNKIQQLFEMCLQDYEFRVLDSAFLVHEGIKRRTSSVRRRNTARQQEIMKNHFFYQRYKQVKARQYAGAPSLAYCQQHKRSLTRGYFPERLRALRHSVNVTMFH